MERRKFFKGLALGAVATTSMAYNFSGNDEEKETVNYSGLMKIILPLSDEIVVFKIPDYEEYISSTTASGVKVGVWRGPYEPTGDRREVLRIRSCPDPEFNCDDWYRSVEVYVSNLNLEKGITLSLIQDF